MPTRALLAVVAAVLATVASGTSVAALTSSSVQSSSEATTAQPSDNPGPLPSEGHFSAIKPGMDIIQDSTPRSSDGNEDNQPTPKWPWGCNPGSDMDNIHYSKGDVSVHGWWYKGDCSNNRAEVTVKLEALWCDPLGCRWIDPPQSPVTPNHDIVYPGGGSANRVVARGPCASGVKTGWRATVEVDVQGEVDNSEIKIQTADMFCRPPF